MEQIHHNTIHRARRLMTRESFLGLMVAGTAAAAGLAISIPIVGYVLGPVIDQPKDVWRDVRLASADGFGREAVGSETIPLGATRKVVYGNPEAAPWAGATGHDASWLRRVGPREFIAFSINCTHLGCPVQYLQDGRLFLCPCHGSVFNDDGTVAGGPAARPLTRYPVRVKHGRVQILTKPLPLVF
jgi:menaquinol-cytochrome c reductase iron-sulfur subunit